MFKSSPRAFLTVRKRPSTTLAYSVIIGILLTTLFLSIRGNADHHRDTQYYARTNRWRFAIISDMDENSKVVSEGEPYWKSMYHKATLTRDPKSGLYSIEWDDIKSELKNHLNEKGRAMELSDLTYFNGRMYTCDDRTGVVYELLEQPDSTKAVPRHILMDGDGNSSKGFKCEWGTVKDGELYIGSFGKEYTGSDGSIINENPLWIKVISKDGTMRHENWNTAYSALRKATDTLHPGYLFHESCNWNAQLHRWFFLPRRLSTDPYSPKVDEQKGANVLISVNEDFRDAKVTTIGTIKDPAHGFSCFRFIPGRTDEILALKTREIGLDDIASFIMIFKIDGEVLMEETQIATGVKFEGCEFFPLSTQ